MARFTCRVPGCRETLKNSHWPTCKACWRRCPSDLLAEVKRAVKLRGEGEPDASWAPWWRAQAEACAAIARVNPPIVNFDIDLWLQHELDFAEELAAEKEAQ